MARSTFSAGDDLLESIDQPSVDDAVRTRIDLGSQLGDLVRTLGRDPVEIARLDELVEEPGPQSVVGAHDAPECREPVQPSSVESLAREQCGELGERHADARLGEADLVGASCRDACVGDQQQHRTRRDSVAFAHGDETHVGRQDPDEEPAHLGQESLRVVWRSSEHRVVQPDAEAVGPSAQNDDRCFRVGLERIGERPHRLETERIPRARIEGAMTNRGLSLRFDHERPLAPSQLEFVYENDMTMPGPKDVLEFWFSPRARPHWFESDAGLDEEIRSRFGPLWEHASSGGCDAWASSSEGALALIIVLDQFPRNMFRGDARSFASDEQALDVSRRAVDAGLDSDLDATQRQFLYMPHMHSEQLEDQERACELFGGPGMPGPEWAEKHKVIIERFGRFPHRNEVLGRTSTPEEVAFLEQPGSSF